MQPVQTLLTKIYALAYPTEQVRVEVAVRSIEVKLRENHDEFKREIKLALGWSVTTSDKNHPDIEVIDLVKDTAGRLRELETDIDRTARNNNIAPEQVLNEIRSLPELENNIDELKRLILKNNERKRELVEKQKKSSREIIKDCKSKIIAEEEKLKELDAINVEVAKDEAEANQVITNQNE